MKFKILFFGLLLPTILSAQDTYEVRVLMVNESDSTGTAETILFGMDKAENMEEVPYPGVIDTTLPPVPLNEPHIGIGVLNPNSSRDVITFPFMIDEGTIAKDKLKINLIVSKSSVLILGEPIREMHGSPAIQRKR